MMEAIPAEQIMQRYEAAYDHFLGRLFSKSKRRQQEAGDKQAEAAQSKQQYEAASGNKKRWLKEKAQQLLDRAGGLEGAGATLGNIRKYFKDDSPSDYEMSFGKEGEQAEKKIMGLPPAAFYTGIGLLVLGAAWYLHKNMNKPAAAAPPSSPLQ